ncbi:hydrogenase expression/formation protein [Acidithiobacillus sp.]
MKPFDAIPIRPAPASDGAANAPALLHEIADAIDILLLSGRQHCIDLSALPLSAADRDMLREVLGTGEIRVAIDTLGNSRMEETGVPGVWWVRHYSEDGVLLTESLEVCRVPEIIPAYTADIAIGLQRLRQRIAPRESGGH